MSIPLLPIAVEVVAVGTHGSIVYVPVFAFAVNPFSLLSTFAVYVPPGVKPVNVCPADMLACVTVAVATGVPVADDPLYSDTS